MLKIHHFYWLISSLGADFIWNEYFNSGNCFSFFVSTLLVFYEGG